MKEKKNENIGKGEEYLNKARNGAKKYVRGVYEKNVKAINRGMDITYEYIGKDNFVEFNDFLEHANTNVDPQRYKQVKDKKLEDPGDKFGKRDFNGNLDRAEKKAAADKESEEYRLKKMRETIDEINRAMDRRNTDVFADKVHGYYAELIRVPDEDIDPYNDVSIRVGDRKVYAHKNLTGDSVTTLGNRPEISQDLLRKAAESITSGDKMYYHTSLETGDSVEVGIKAKLGGKEVSLIVQDDIKKGSVITRPEGKYIGRGLWDEAYTWMQDNKNPRHIAMMEDGTKVECSVMVKIDGKIVDIEGINRNDDRGEKTIFGKEAWEAAYNEMMQKGSQSWGTVTPDGSVIECFMNVKVNGKDAYIDPEMQNKNVRDMPERMYISRENYNESIEAILSDSSGANKTSIQFDNGRAIDLHMDMKVNGVAASPNIRFKEGEIRETRNGISVSDDLLMKAMNTMKKNESTWCRLTARDGRELTFRRSGKLHVFIDGKEIDNREDLAIEKAIAEISGQNNDQRRNEKGMSRREDAEQAELTIRRSITTGAISAPKKGIDTIQKTAEKGANAPISIIGSLIRKLLNSNYIGR